jgi:hypothetical protein
VAGFVVAVRAVWHFGANRGVNPRRILAWGFVAMALTGVFGAVTAGGPAYDLTKRTYFAAALLVLGIWPRLDERGKARAMNALFVLFAAVHLLGPFLVPDPHIDNWAWTQACLKALLHGVQPYTLTMADVPGAEYARSPISAYPYPPLTLVVLAPAFLIFGDYRIALAVSMSAAVLLLRTAGRSLRLGREQLDAASLLVLLNPRSFTATCFGHIEPVMALALIAFSCLAAREASPFAQGLAFWTVPGLKQYFIAPALLFVGVRKRLPTAPVLVSGLVVLATVLPFVVWNGSATWHSLWLEVAEWTSPDVNATSLTAAAFKLGWPYPGRNAAPVVQLIVGGLVGWRLRHAGLAGLFLGSAVALLATFLIGWQAYPHYYFLVTVLLALGAVFLSATTRATGDDMSAGMTRVETQRALS